MYIIVKFWEVSGSVAARQLQTHPKEWNSEVEALKEIWETVLPNNFESLTTAQLS